MRSRIVQQLSNIEKSLKYLNKNINLNIKLKNNATSSCLRHIANFNQPTNFNGEKINHTCHKCLSFVGFKSFDNVIKYKEINTFTQNEQKVECSFLH